MRSSKRLAGEGVQNYYQRALSAVLVIVATVTTCLSRQPCIFCLTTARVCACARVHAWVCSARIHVRVRQRRGGGGGGEACCVYCVCGSSGGGARGGWGCGRKYRSAVNKSGELYDIRKNYAYIFAIFGVQGSADARMGTGAAKKLIKISIDTLQVEQNQC